MTTTMNQTTGIVGGSYLRMDSLEQPKVPQPGFCAQVMNKDLPDDELVYELSDTCIKDLRDQTLSLHDTQEYDENTIRLDKRMKPVPTRPNSLLSLVKPDLHLFND